MAKMKSFKNDNPLDRMEGSDKSHDINSTVKLQNEESIPTTNVDEATEIQIEEPETKKKLGRPKVKTEKCKTINIAIPISMLKKMEVAKLKYSNNLTAYVNAVIKADLDANYEKYLQLQEIINS